MTQLSQSDLTAIQAAYDFENVFPTAAAAVLTSFGIKAATIATVSQFESERPRVELLFKTGQGKLRLLPPNGQELAWDGALVLTIVTNATEEDKKVQAQYACLLRYLMPQMARLMNGDLLPNHHVNNPIRDAGTTLTNKNSDGYWITSITWNFDFTIQPAALANLTQQ